MPSNLVDVSLVRASQYLAVVQYMVGLGGFLWPKMSGRQRAALSPVHVFLGKTVFVMGLATMAVCIPTCVITKLSLFFDAEFAVVMISHIQAPGVAPLLLLLTILASDPADDLACASAGKDCH